MIARYAAFCAALVLALAGSRAFAFESISDRNFGHGRWLPVKVFSILDKVPEWQPSNEVPGSVMPPSQRQGWKPVEQGCPIVENGERVGWSMNCTRGAG